MRIPRTISCLLVYVSISGSLFACNVFNQRTQLPGVTYVTSLGNPAASSLIWSPTDSTKLLVNANSLTSRHARVYILDTITRKKTMLVDTDEGDIGGSAWSPDGKHIALSVVGGSKVFSQGGLWMINTDDNSMENIFDKYGAAFWLPDGNTLAFQTVDFASSQNPRQVSIYLTDFQTKELKLIYSNQEAIAFSGLSTSPDGRYLVFSLMFDYYDDMDLHILEVQTGTVSQLTHNGVSSFPQWSPRGGLIAYQKWSKVDNKTISSLHITLPDGSCDLEIPNVKYGFSPTWSPDGREIAFIGEDGIYVLDTDIVFGRDIYQELCPE